jgi:HlyD family secretion protein
VAAVTASGKIQPKKKVDISADITGRITRIAVREGDLVQKGQFLLQIDATIYQANLQRANAAMSSAEAGAVQAKATRDQSSRALVRTKELREQNPNLVSQEQLEQAQTAFDIAEANLNASQHLVEQARAGLQEARDQLAKTHLTAPMDGRVTRLAVEEGEVAVPGTFSRETGLLLTVSDLSVIQTTVNVDETDVVRVNIGDSVEVTIDAFPDTTFVGRVTKVSNSAILTGASSVPGQNDRAVDYEVEITLSNPPAEVRPDLSATARIVTDTRKQALAIPIIALTVRENTPIATEHAASSGGPKRAEAATPDTSKRSGEQGKKKETEGVFVVHNGVASFRAVKVGIAGEEHFEVMEGVRQGDTIVAGPYQAVRDLKEGAHVRPSKESGDTTNRRRS